MSKVATGATAHVQPIHVARNMARYYRLAIEPTLFGDLALVRNWGRIGTRGQERVDLFNTGKQPLSHFLAIQRDKRRKGYRPASLTVDRSKNLIEDR